MAESLVFGVDVRAPDSVHVAGRTWHRRPEFHLTTFIPDDLAEATGIDRDALARAAEQLASELTAVRPIRFDGRVARCRHEDGRHTLVAFCDVGGLEDVFARLDELLDTRLPRPPAHVTLFTVEPGMQGIGLATEAAARERCEPLGDVDARGVLDAVDPGPQHAWPDAGRAFDDTGGERLLDGEIVEVERRRFRYRDDGKEVERDVVRHPGGVAIVAHDGRHVLLVRQPRQAVGEPHLLEIPAGRLDQPGESPLQAARRELAEELGRSAERWTPLTRFYPSADVLDSEVHVFLAEELGREHADSGEDERIEVVPWPLDRLHEAIADNRDAKTLIGLLMLADRLRAGG